MKKKKNTPQPIRIHNRHECDYCPQWYDNKCNKGKLDYCRLVRDF